jgi:hypothetical protein
MATVALTTTPTQIDDGTSYTVLVTNTGAVEVDLSRGGRLRPQQSRTVYPEGTALTAAATSGTGTVTTSTTSKPLPNAADPAALAANAAFTGTYAKRSRYDVREVAGFVGNGTADDTVAFQAAINAAAAAGLSCFVPDGVSIRTTAPITLPSNTHLLMGVNAQVIRNHATATATGSTFINSDQTNGNSNVIIEGGRIYALSSADTGKHFGFTGVSHLQILRVKLQGVYGDWNAALKNCNDVIINGCDWDSGTALYADGIHLYGGSRVTISDCIIKCGDDAISLTTEAADCNWIEDVTITNCVLYSRAASGFKIGRVSTATTGIRRVQLSNCAITKGDNYAIWLFDNSDADDKVYDVTVSNVTIDCTSASAGEVIRSLGVDGVTFRDIKVLNPNGLVMRVAAGGGISPATCVNANVIGLRVPTQAAANATTLRVDQTSGFRIRDCYIKGATQYGILLGSATAVSSGVVEGNTVDTATSSGIRLVNASATRVISNRVSGCATSIVEIAPSAANIIQFNDVNGNTTSTITVASANTFCNNNQGSAPNPGLGIQDERLYLGSNSAARQSFSRWPAGASITGPGSGTMQMVAVPLYSGDVVTNLSFISGSTALTMGTNVDGHLWFALYDGSGNLLGQSADQGGSATWVANAMKTLPLASPYTVTTTGVYYAAVMVNFGTGGTPVVPAYRGLSGNTTLWSSFPTGASGKTMAGTNGSALTTTAPTGPITPTVSAVAPYCEIT